jgi:6-phosphogluconolactonase (cycloisomerase 2 family)
LIIFVFASFFITCGENTHKKVKKTLLFVGGYTDSKPADGIKVYEFDEVKGNLKLLYAEPNLINPSYLILSPNGDALYTCLDSRMPYEGRVGSYKINTNNGTLTFINSQPSGGRNPVHVSLSKKGDYLVSSNYTDASISVFKIDQNNKLSSPLQVNHFQDSSIITGRQDEAHLHSTNFSQDGTKLVAMDLGADKIRIFSFDDSKTPPLQEENPSAIRTTPGSGPRHFAFHPTKPFGYCAEELSGTVAAFKWNKAETLEAIDRDFSYSQNLESYATADIHISQDGRFLYATNRIAAENTISVFTIDQQSGQIDLIQHESVRGDHPRNFTLDPSGNWLLVANQLSNNIVIFKRNKDSGKLTFSGEIIDTPAPSCLKMKEYYF